ncbi:uncharacterized protein LOC131671362 [Phymastichus coffea]|uniref:uncharacterized protein LOC131671362 n=1 Tax=Phymastichus coffea TaxID=108790 RepID=UPI00273B26D7|nr:uncharacterized protein LOC131671362 [Phymastichus coffea]
MSRKTPRTPTHVPFQTKTRAQIAAEEQAAAVAITSAEIFVREIVCRYGVPLEVHTNKGRNFDAKLIKQLSQLLDIQKTRTTPLPPQSDGQVERHNMTILDYLAKYISDNQKDWDRWIALYLLAYRSSIHATTETSPAKMYTGSDLRLPLDLMRGRLPEVKNPHT